MAIRGERKESDSTSIGPNLRERAAYSLKNWPKTGQFVGSTFARLPQPRTQTKCLVINARGVCSSHPLSRAKRQPLRDRVGMRTWREKLRLVISQRRVEHPL